MNLCQFQIPGETSSPTPPSPPPCWTDSSTKVSSYTSTETATDSEPTKPATKNYAPKEVIARVHHRTQGGEFHRATLGNFGERRQQSWWRGRNVAKTPTSICQDNPAESSSPTISPPPKWR